MPTSLKSLMDRKIVTVALLAVGMVALMGLAVFVMPVNAQRYSTERDDQSRYSNRPQDDQGYRDERPRRGTYCQQLERELANDWVRGRQSGNVLPELNQTIRKQDGVFNKLRRKADTMDCYENMFIFGRSLKRTRRCLAIDKKIHAAKRKLARLEKERENIRDSRNQGNRRDRLIAELSRNGCGDQYRYEARRARSGNWFGDGAFGDLFNETQPRRRRREVTPDAIQPYATYRTMCVRSCDGFYFPVSFSTLPSGFDRDMAACQNKCAAPAELYVYRNPGGEVEEMIAPDGRPYDMLKNAWRFRKEFVKGCSCKQAEYSQADIDAHNNKDGDKKRDAGGNKGAAKTTPDGDAKSAAKKTAQKTNGETAAKTRPDTQKARSIEDLIR